VPKAENTFLGLQVDATRAILRATPPWYQRVGARLLTVTMVDLHEVLVGELVIGTESLDSLERAALLALDPLVLLDATQHPMG
jgi:hypothetical protein